MTNIVFVDENDVPIGAGTKQEATEKGIIHRVIRIFIMNSKGEILLQKRSDNCITSPGKWDQSVGGHVDEGESYDEAAYRELKEELGIEGVELQEITKYYSEGEHLQNKNQFKRFNTIYTGGYDGEFILDPEEVSEVKWISPTELEAWIERDPNELTNGAINAYKHLKSASR
jgi:isopentenyl-diphosphate delta-isomerase type 1